MSWTGDNRAPVKPTGSQLCLSPHTIRRVADSQTRSTRCPSQPPPCILFFCGCSLSRCLALSTSSYSALTLIISPSWKPYGTCPTHCDLTPSRTSTQPSQTTTQTSRTATQPQVPPPLPGHSARVCPAEWRAMACLPWGLSQVGATMSELPLDPQLAKMVVASPQYRSCQLPCSFPAASAPCPAASCGFSTPAYGFLCLLRHRHALCDAPLTLCTLSQPLETSCQCRQEVLRGGWVWKGGATHTHSTRRHAVGRYAQPGE